MFSASTSASAFGSIQAGTSKSATTSPSPPGKASIINLDDRSAPPIDCLFNPREYTHTKENTWTPQEAMGTDEPAWHFAAGGSAAMALDLVFDTYASGKDVREAYTEALWNLTLIDPNLTDKGTYPDGRPPYVRFVWGTAWSFDAILTAMTQRFTLFAPDGTPLRANVNLSLTQLAKLKSPQNPTSRGETAPHLWTVKDGDTLASIAYAEYGRCADWRRIADANRLVQVRHLEIGATLELPHAG